MKNFISKNLNATVIAHATKLTETWKKFNYAITASCNITIQQWAILLLLANDPNLNYIKDNQHEKPLMAKELADALNVSRANITNLLNVLIAEKLVLQTEDKIDKRRKRLTLTSKGTEVLLNLEANRTKFNDLVFAKFSNEEKEKFNWFAKECIDCMELSFSKKKRTEIPVV